MKPVPSRNPNRSLTLGLMILLVLVVAGFWLPPIWLWGLNHGRWLPWPVRFGIPAAAFLLVVTPARNTFGRLLVDRFEPLLLGRRPIAYFLVPAVGAAVFWLLRDPIHMLGDGQTLAVMLAGDNLYHGFDFMTYHLLAKIYQSLGAGGESSAFFITALMSCLSGAAYLAAAAWSARKLTDHPGSRILLYGLLVLATPLQLFFGYMEVYAPLAVAMLVFLTFFTLYREGRGRLLYVALAWSTGLFLHLNALFLAPLLAVALLRPPPEEQASTLRRLITVVGPVLAALLLAWGILAAGGYGSERFLTDFGHVDQGDGILVPLTGPDGLLTWRHLKDTVNLLLLLAPIPLLLLGVHFGNEQGGLRGLRALPCLLGGSVWLIVLIALIHLKLGAARDWDLLAPHVSVLVLAGWYAISGGFSKSTPAPGLVGQVVAVAAVLALPWFAVNANPAAALARLEAVATDLAPYPRGLLHEQFAYHHQMAGNPEEVARHYRKSGEVCSNHPRFHAIYGTYMLNQGNLAEAVLAYDRAVAADPGYVYGLKMGLVARVLDQDYRGALEPARRLLQMNAQDSEAAAAHGTAAQQVGLRAEAIAAYLRGFQRDGTRLDLLERAAGLQLMEGEFTAAQNNFRTLLEARPDRIQAALGLADALWQGYLTDPDARPRQESRAVLAEAAILIERVLAAQGSPAKDTASLTAWRDQVLTAAAALQE